jgi:hypothetical protein
MIALKAHGGKGFAGGAIRRRTASLLAITRSLNIS